MSDISNDSIMDGIIKEYRPDLDRLMRYLPWLTNKKKSDVQGTYTGDDQIKVIPIPVYDSTLLQFVKEAGNSKFADRNYPYVYTRYRIKTHEDEIRVLNMVKGEDINVFRGILSKYVLGGRTKASMWAEGVDAGIYKAVLETLDKKFKIHESSVSKDKL